MQGWQPARAPAPPPTHTSTCTYLVPVDHNGGHHDDPPPPTGPCITLSTALRLRTAQRTHHAACCVGADMFGSGHAAWHSRKTLHSATTWRRCPAHALHSFGTHRDLTRHAHKQPSPTGSALRTVQVKRHHLPACSTASPPALSPDPPTSLGGAVPCLPISLKNNVRMFLVK